MSVNHIHACGGQTRALDPLELELWPPCGLWELNPGTLQEQQELLAAESFPQPHTVNFNATET